MRFELKPARERLSNKEIQELAQIATDTNRSRNLRSWIFVLLGTVENLEQRIDLAPFFKMIENSADDPSLRVDAIELLESAHGPGTRVEFLRLLNRVPVTENDEAVWRRLKVSPILKDHQ